MSGTLVAAKTTDVRWMTRTGVAGFVNSRLWGVTDGAGRWLTFDGIAPGTWTRRTAVEIAETIDRSNLRFVQDVAK